MSGERLPLVVGRARAGQRAVTWPTLRDSLLHALGGAAVGALFAWAAVAVVPLVIVLLGVGGYFREWWQHRDDPKGLNPRNWTEALAWPIGGFIGGLVTIVVLQ